MVHEEYYRKRAREYEAIYHGAPNEAKHEQEIVSAKLKKLCKSRNVIEAACGTGYWTKIISEIAKSIVAFDKVKEVIEVAKSKKYKCPVKFDIKDAFNLSYTSNKFDAGVSILWVSHIKKNELMEFLKGFHKVLDGNSVVFFADNVYNPQYGELRYKKGDRENTYKLRRLGNGEEFMILKNYYTKKELFDIFRRFSNFFSMKNISYGKNYWSVWYFLK